MMVGPKRSGRGTIARVLKALAGSNSVVNPTLSTLARPFGLSTLIGKPIAVFPDARLSSRPDNAAIVECLLSISGEDDQTIDRKHMPAWTGKLPTRFVLISNELPRLRDVSGALAGRLIILRFTRSFYGQEDTGPLRPPAARVAGDPPLGDRRLGTVESTGPVPAAALGRRAGGHHGRAGQSDRRVPPRPLRRRARRHLPGLRHVRVLATPGARNTAATPSATSTRSAATCTRPFRASPRSGPELRWADYAITRESACAPPTILIPSWDPRNLSRMRRPKKPLHSESGQPSWSHDRYTRYSGFAGRSIIFMGPGWASVKGRREQ